MSTMVIYGDAADTYAYAQSTTYSRASAGLDGVSVTSDSSTSGFVGQQKSGATYSVYQLFLKFDLGSNLPAGAVMTGFTLTCMISDDGSLTDFDLWAKTYDWGEMGTADWQDTAGTGTPYAGLATSNKSVDTAYTFDQYNMTNFAEAEDPEGFLSLVLVSANQHYEIAPTGNEYVGFYTQDAAEGKRPYVTVTYTVPVTGTSTASFGFSAAATGVSSTGESAVTFTSTASAAGYMAPSGTSATTFLSSASGAGVTIDVYGTGGSVFLFSTTVVAARFLTLAEKYVLLGYGWSLGGFRRQGSRRSGGVGSGAKF